MLFYCIISEDGLEFCPFLLIPEKKLRDEYLIDTRRVGQLSPVQQLDSCCLLNLKCDRQKKSELNGTEGWQNIRHCDCEREFSECIQKVKALESDLIAFGHGYSINTPKCFTNDYPIDECVKFQYFFQPLAKFNRRPSQNAVISIRCVQYKFDVSKPKSFQLLDLPFSIIGLDDVQIDFIFQLGKIVPIDYLPIKDEIDKSREKLEPQINHHVGKMLYSALSQQWNDVHSRFWTIEKIDYIKKEHSLIINGKS